MYRVFDGYLVGGLGFQLLKYFLRLGLSSKSHCDLWYMSLFHELQFEKSRPTSNGTDEEIIERTRYDCMPDLGLFTRNISMQWTQAQKWL